MDDRIRHAFLALMGALIVAGFLGCATPFPGAKGGEWAQILEEGRDDLDIIVQGRESSKILRQRAEQVPLDMDLTILAERMEKTMRDAGGVGIAGPQVGFRLAVVTVMLDADTEAPRVIFARNPVITMRSDETVDGYEGCLSIPDVGGVVRRNKWVVVEYIDEQGERIKEYFEGFNAVIWQHELDHLDGILYTDRLRGELMSIEEMRRRREAEKEIKEEITRV